jgi:hypothetical protein
MSKFKQPVLIKYSFKKFSHQGGWTFWSAIVVMSMLGFFAYVGMQLVPIYTSNQSVKSAMDLSLVEVDPKTISRGYIVRKIQDQLYLDSSGDFIDYKKELTVKRVKSNIVLNVKYQREVPLFSNLSLLVRFENVSEARIGE